MIWNDEIGEWESSGPDEERDDVPEMDEYREAVELFEACFAMDVRPVRATLDVTTL